MKSLLKLMRIRHYVKNLLVFVPLVCSGQLFFREKLLSGLLAFGFFCMDSSAVYIINDIKDKEKDRNHPTKCNRPIAAGNVSIRSAVFIAFLLVVASVLGSLRFFSGLSTLVLISYLAINISYSFGLKDIPILDVAILALGFLLRILYGTIVTGIILSNWLYLTVITVAFYFGLGKRRNELKKIDSGETRHVLKKYSISFLDKNMNMCLTLGNAFYALWTMNESTILLYNTKYLILTVPIVFIITMKYSLVIEGESDGDPVEVLFRDKWLVFLCVVYVAVMFTLLYL